MEGWVGSSVKTRIYISDFVHAKLLQSCLTLCDPVDCSSPGSSVHGNLQARILKWLAVPSSRGYSRSRDWTWVSHVSCTCRRVLLYTHSLKGAKADMFYYLTFSFSKKKKSCIFKFWAAPCSMWDLSSPTRDQTHRPCIGRQSLNLWEVPDLLYSLSPALCTAPSYPGLESLRLEKLLQWDPPSAGLNHAVIAATSTTWLPVT